MERFREVMMAPGAASIRESVISDLSGFYGMADDEVVERCRGWEQWSVEEWKSAQRTANPLETFYQTVRSWSFDLLWYAYLQSEGYRFPVSAAIVDSLGGRRGSHLDFGSGVGTTSQLFAAVGWRTQLADISTPLLDFARHRWRRRGAEPETLDLKVQQLPQAQYDVITAIDTLVHVPDLDRVLPQLHAALKPGGLMFANFDTRPVTDENAWHLYSNDLPLRWKLHRSGFEPEESLDGFSTRYRWVEPRGLAHRVRAGRDLVLLRSPLRPAYRRLRYRNAGKPPPE